MPQIIYMVIYQQASDQWEKHCPEQCPFASFESACKFAVETYKPKNPVPVRYKKEKSTHSSAWKFELDWAYLTIQEMAIE